MSTTVVRKPTDGIAFLVALGWSTLTGAIVGAFAGGGIPSLVLLLRGLQYPELAAQGGFDFLWQVAVFGFVPFGGGGLVFGLLVGLLMGITTAVIAYIPTAAIRFTAIVLAGVLYALFVGYCVLPSVEVSPDTPISRPTGLVLYALVGLLYGVVVASVVVYRRSPTSSR